MPLRRQLSRIGKRITIKDYELVFDPGLNRWIFTHLLADQYNIANGIYKEAYGDHRHHIDFNKKTTTPLISNVFLETNISIFTKHFWKKHYIDQMLSKSRGFT